MDWRRSFQEMEHHRYQHLRELRWRNSLWDQSDDDLRRQAYEYATESCREAVARYNADH